MTVPVQGASGASYALSDAGLDGLRRQYDLLYERFGSLKVAVTAIAALLDTPAVAFDGLRPDVAKKLVEALEVWDHRPPSVPDSLTVEQIGAICYETNAGYCRLIGERDPLPWDLAEPWERETVIEGIQNILAGLARTPEQSHGFWCAKKRHEGWTWGPRRDPVAKTHPCLTAYENLALAQQRKDALFFAIVRALAFGPDTEPQGDTAETPRPLRILEAPVRHPLADCLRELKFGRPVADQRFLDAVIADLDGHARQFLAVAGTEAMRPPPAGDATGPEV